MMSDENDRFEYDRWTLVVEFDDLTTQSERDPECAFPHDDVSRLVAEIGKRWGGLPEELPGYCRWTDTRIEITSNVFDAYYELLPWLVMHTIPVRLELTRR